VQIWKRIIEHALAKMITTYYLYLIGLIVVIAAIRLILVDK